MLARVWIHFQVRADSRDKDRTVRSWGIECTAYSERTLNQLYRIRGTALAQLDSNKTKRDTDLTQ
jgi:hypothetical protein